MEIIRSKIFKQAIRFLITGFIAMFIDIAVYLLLINIVGIFYSKGISFICATVFTFLMNKYWTFEKKELSFNEIIKFIIFYLFSAFINAAINERVFILTEDKTAAFIAATGFCTFLNFFGLKFFVFNKKKRNSTEPDLISTD